MGALAPGFRFCPTDEELLIYYLKPKAWGKDFPQGTIAEVDIYKFEPWDLPDKSALTTKDPEWYFFGTQDKKYSHTARINRTTARGYWKATGKDRKINSGRCTVGLKKTLIYYEGRAPNGRRTNWIMHEYRLDQDSEKKETGASISVLCRIRKKGGPGPRNGEQYGAPIWNEDGEIDDDSNSGKLSVSTDVGPLKVDNVEKRGNAFNLQNQVAGLRSSGSIGSVKLEFGHSGTDVNPDRTINGALNWSMSRDSTGSVSDMDGIKACKTDLEGDSKSMYDTPCFDRASNIWEEPLSYHHPYMDLDDMGTLYGLDNFSGLPTLTNCDGHNLHDYVLPAFDEPDILEELLSLVNDSELSSKGVDNGMAATQIKGMAASEPTSKDSPKCVSHVGGGDYIELVDIEIPLGGSVMRSPTRANVPADNRVPATRAVQDPLGLHGSDARRVCLQVPDSSWSEGGINFAVQQLMGTQTLTPKVEKHTYRGSKDISIPITHESHNNDDSFARNVRSSNFESSVMRNEVESSTRSYLSKHMSTYAVSKLEVVPPQLCYALNDIQDDSMEAKEITKSLTALSIKDEKHAVVEKFEVVPRELCYASSINIQDEAIKKADSLTALLIKEEKQIDADNLGKIGVCFFDSTASTTPLTKTINFEGRRFKGAASSGSKGCNFLSKSAGESILVNEDGTPQDCSSSVEHANMRASRRLMLKAYLKGLKGKLKQSVLVAKLTQLEEGMRTKFNDRLSVHGKGAPVQLISTEEEDATPFDTLKRGILATLYHLATAVLILSCLFWGYHVVTKYVASSVSVQ